MESGREERVEERKRKEGKEVMLGTSTRGYTDIQDIQIYRYTDIQIYRGESSTHRESQV